ncbi:MAG: type 1 glutamine amidotransferase domain-containing protein [Sphingomonas sp.]|nr:MAG: type 1 glutamine amidotransferase domain-containing protein [Sphingomonas sp.]
MPASIIFILTSQSALGTSGQKTGTWLEELAAPYYRFVDAGHSVQLASVAGGEAPLDPASLEAPWVTEQGARFRADPAALAALSHTARLSSIDPTEFAAFYLVGGAGAAWDFPVDADVRRIVEAISRQGGVASGVCHGVLGLTSALDEGGAPLIAGKQVTGVSNKEEELTGFDKLVPVLPESRLVELGGQYSAAAEPFGAHVVRDGWLVTGQNPASAALVADTVLDLLANTD